MTKTLEYSIQFAKFCTQHKCNPVDLANLVDLTKKRVKLEVNILKNILNSPDVGGKWELKSAKLTLKMEDLAKKINFDGLIFPGLYPELTFGEQTYTFPID